MNIDVNRLKGKTVEKGLTGEKMAIALGIDQSTYYRKLGDGGGTFTISQVARIAEILSLTNEERTEIFLGHNSRKREKMKGASDAEQNNRVYCVCYQFFYF